MLTEVHTFKDIAFDIDFICLRPLVSHQLGLQASIQMEELSFLRRGKPSL